MLPDLINRTRTYRRFDPTKRISRDLLSHFIDLARVGGSARNLQPWKYMICDKDEHCAIVFPHLGWAGYLPEWSGPAEDERPTAYILCLLDTNLASDADFDLGIASQNILLAAMSHGIGGCRIASISPALGKLFNLPDNLGLKLVIALGYPTEEVTMVSTEDDGNIKYWHGDNKSHFVPKRPLREILLPLSL